MVRRRRWRGARAVLASIALVCGCHRPMDKIDTLRQAWASGDRQAAAHAVEVAECPPPPATFSVSPCLDAAARAFGSTAFSTEKPDQASAAAVAYVLARRRTGEGLPSPDTWL